MNEQSPLVPQGSFESQARRKSHVRIAVFSILAVHVVVLGGLLILGCKREDSKGDTAGNPPLQTNDLVSAPPFGSDPLMVSTNTQTIPPATTTPTVVQTGNSQPAPNVVTTPAMDTPATEHKIVTGDRLEVLAKKHGVTTKAILDANPNLVPTKLKVGDVVKIPAKSSGLAKATPTPDAPDVYTVKSGDNLGLIAKNHKTTVKELQRMNNLTTTMIKVGDKIKVPLQAAGAPGSGSVTQ